MAPLVSVGRTPDLSPRRKPAAATLGWLPDEDAAGRVWRVWRVGRVGRVGRAFPFNCWD
ncbi:MAG: hypothetical protein JWO76_1232 [Nocardioides sp.]|nr:hypothetical protein [Nocardioides sp.]